MAQSFDDLYDYIEADGKGMTRTVETYAKHLITLIEEAKADKIEVYDLLTAVEDIYEKTNR